MLLGRCRQFSLIRNVWWDEKYNDKDSCLHSLECGCFIHLTESLDNFISYFYILRRFIVVGGTNAIGWERKSVWQLEIPSDILYAIWASASSLMYVDVPSSRWVLPLILVDEFSTTCWVHFIVLFRVHFGVLCVVLFAALSRILDTQEEGLLTLIVKMMKWI